MYNHPGVKTDQSRMAVPDQMRAWVLGDPEQLIFTGTRDARLE